MIEIFKGVALGIIEGVTEFLPISSTGHLILANQFISFSEPFTQKFDVIIQLGAILAVVLVYRNKLIPNRENPLRESVTLWSKIIVAVIPALFIGALFHHKIETLLFNPIVVSIALVFWGIVLIVMESIKFRIKFESMASLGYGTAFLIGLLQCLAMIPGTSRSAATIIGAMLLGASRLVAVEFSFFLAVPTLAAASVYSMYMIGFDISTPELVVLTAGFITSFLVAWAVIRFLLNYITNRDFKPFGYYRIILGGIVLVYFLCLR
jgi:undecaprenyl-diphosphatase